MDGFNVKPKKFECKFVARDGDGKKKKKRIAKEKVLEQWKNLKNK